MDLLAFERTPRTGAGLALPDPVPGTSPGTLGARAGPRVQQCIGCPTGRKGEPWLVGVGDAPQVFRETLRVWEHGNNDATL